MTRRRWKHRDRVLQALVAASLICAAGYLSRVSLPALTRRAARVAAGRHRASISQAAKLSASRPVYPYSVIRGGAYTRAELIDALDRDPVAARHYLAFNRSSIHATDSPFSEPVFLSYRVGNEVYWTSRPVRLPRGETLLTDGKNYARARCGNRVSETPRTPVSDTEPAPETLNRPRQPENAVADLNTWSENRLTTELSPLLAQVLPAQAVPVSAVYGSPPPMETIPSWWSTVPPGGFLYPPAVSTPPLYVPVPIQPNPIPGLVFLPSPGGVYPPTGFTPPGSPAPPVPSTPTTVTVIPPVLPPGIWPPIPIIPNTPETPVGPPGPTVPTTPQTPTQSVPEPFLAPPVLLACAAILAAKLRRRS